MGELRNDRSTPVTGAAPSVKTGVLKKDDDDRVSLAGVEFEDAVKGLLNTTRPKD